LDKPYMSVASILCQALLLGVLEGGNFAVLGVPRAPNMYLNISLWVFTAAMGYIET